MADVIEKLFGASKTPVINWNRLRRERNARLAAIPAVFNRPNLAAAALQTKRLINAQRARQAQVKNQSLKNQFVTALTQNMSPEMRNSTRKRITMILNSLNLNLVKRR